MLLSGRLALTDTLYERRAGRTLTTQSVIRKSLTTNAGWGSHTVVAVEQLSGWACATLGVLAQNLATNAIGWREAVVAIERLSDRAGAGFMIRR